MGHLSFIANAIGSQGIDLFLHEYSSINTTQAIFEPNTQVRFCTHIATPLGLFSLKGINFDPTMDK